VNYERNKKGARFFLKHSVYNSKLQRCLR